jgi:hypothetical protein
MGDDQHKNRKEDFRYHTGVHRSNLGQVMLASDNADALHTNGMECRAWITFG